MTSYIVELTYSAYGQGTVKFPKGKTWADVADHHVKWDSLHIQFKGSDDWVSFDLETMPETDTKRPSQVYIYENTPDYMADDSKLVFSTEN